MKQWALARIPIFETVSTPKGKWCPQRLSRYLLSCPPFGFLYVYPDREQYYLYDPTLGYYSQLGPHGIKMVLRQTLDSLDPTLPHEFLLRVLDNFRYGSRACMGVPRPDKTKLVFTNGLLERDSLTLVPWTPEYLVTSRLGCAYDREATCPLTLDFLTSLAQGHEDRVHLLRCWFSALVRGLIDVQVVLFMVGPGGTGKSTFALLATALVGRDFTVTTSLRSLHSDPFEVANLQGKSLILVSDSERYRGDLSVLKQLSGGDALKGRMKFVQGSFEIQPEGLMLITANQNLDSEDTSDSIRRRLRVFPAYGRLQRSESRPLLWYGKDGFLGPLSEELSGIINWVLGVAPEEARRVLGDPSGVSSLREMNMEVEETLNPMTRWVREEVVQAPEGGAYIGYKLMDGFKARHELSQRRPLYPTYEVWSRNHGLKPLSHRTFSNELLDALHMEGIQAQRLRKEQGSYIAGIIVKPQVYDRDYSFGAPLAGAEQGFQTQTPEYHRQSLGVLNDRDVQMPLLEASREVLVQVDPKRGVQGQPEPEPEPKERNTIKHIRQGAANKLRGSSGSVATFYPELVHPAVMNQLYHLYVQALGKSPLKIQANRFARLMKIDVENLAQQITQSCQVSSPSYQESVLKVLSSGAQQLRQFGAIPYSYKQMGVSPRLLPVAYGKSINNCKRALRLQAYEQLGDFFAKEGFVLLDLDLTSCYTSILLGLFPQDLEAIQRAIEGPGLWKYIHSEFIRNGKGDCYHKPAVKICVYASFFLGGNNAMMTGVMEGQRLELGMTEKEFKAAPFYEEVYALAQKVAGEMLNSSVIADFRSVSKKIHDIYLDDFLIGPTGHKFWVDDVNFRSSYPSYLQSYEFCLLAQATLKTIQEFPRSEVVGHYHDGNVVAVQAHEEQPFMDSLSRHLRELGSQLGLSYPQRIEVKSRFPK